MVANDRERLDGWTTSLDDIVWLTAAYLHVISPLNIC